MPEEADRAQSGIFAPAVSPRPRLHLTGPLRPDDAAQIPSHESALACEGGSRVYGSADSEPPGSEQHNRCLRAHRGQRIPYPSAERIGVAMCLVKRAPRLVHERDSLVSNGCYVFPDVLAAALAAGQAFDLRTQAIQAGRELTSSIQSGWLAGRRSEGTANASLGGSSTARFAFSRMRGTPKGVDRSRFSSSRRVGESP